MALIQCPECGKMVSDRAGSCPSCGLPLNAQTPPPAPNAGPMYQNAGNGISLTAMKCPNCGGPLERISKDMARCKNCPTEVCLSGVGLSDNETVESILPFKSTKDEFHVKCMKELMLVGEEDVFSQISNIKVKQYFMWVRQFGHGEKQEFYPMDTLGEKIFKMMSGKTPILPYKNFNAVFPKDDFRIFQPRYIGDAEMKKKEFTPAEVKQKYMSIPSTSGFSAHDFYFCIPVFEETFEYKGETYHFYGSGTDDISWFASDKLPKNKHITTKPNYTTAYPLMYTVIGIMALGVLFYAGGFVIEAFSDGFASGIFTLIIAGAILSAIGWVLVAILGVVGAVIAGVFAIVDIPIQKSINAKRRIKYRAEYERIQKRKQEEARINIGLELAYVVPEFPIP